MLLLSSGFFSSCSGLFYYPDRSLYYLPGQTGDYAEEYEFKSSDGIKLVGWFFPAYGKGSTRPPLGTIVQFHGNGENISSHYRALAWLAKEGYGVFTFDYRGYGKSDDVKTDQKGTYLDGLAALAQAYSIHREAKAKKFVVFGQSLGGAIAMRSLEDFPERAHVALMVMDSTFVSYKDIARRSLARSPITWLFSPLGMVLVSDAYSAEDWNRASQTPLLVIHDRKDPVVSFGAGEELYEEATAPEKEMWTPEDGRHIGAFDDPNGIWRRKFLELLRKIPAR